MLSQILSAEARERRKVKSEISGCSCLLGLLFFFSSLYNHIFICLSALEFS